MINLAGIAEQGHTILHGKYQTWNNLIPEHSNYMNKTKKCFSKILSCWPFLFVPVTILYVYLVKSIGLDELCSRHSTEIIALPLVGTSVLSYFFLACKTKNELAIAMTFLSAAFFCREWHFFGTSNGIYVAIALFTGWFIYRRNIVDGMIDGRKIKIWLFATASCYVWSQIIARRVFSERHLGILPLEGAYHIFMEESLEVAGHFLLIITSIIAWSTFYFKQNKPEN